jgi:hypothetical protein
MRKSLIAHYTAIGHRNDMQAIQRHKNGGIYFDLKADRTPKSGVIEARAVNTQTTSIGTRLPTTRLS